MADLTPNNDVTPDPVAPATDATPAKSYVIVSNPDGSPSAQGTGEVAPVATGSTGSTEVIERGTPYSGAVETPTADPGTVAPVQGYAPAFETGPVAPQIVYVTAPTPPRIKSNRGAGVAIAALASAIYALVLAVIVIVVVNAVAGGGASVQLLAQLGFYMPVIFFVVGFIVLALIVNRGGWWAYIIGSIAVAAFVYFGSTAAILLANGIVTATPELAADSFSRALASPVAIAAGLLAREVALWGGAVISRFGRGVKTRNAESLATFEAEQRANANATPSHRP